MFELIKSEYARYKKWLIITAILNTLLIFSGIYFDDYEQSGTAVGMAFTLLLGINALMMGVSQMKTYRPTNMWTYLINRPIKPAALCLGLLAAGVAVIVSAMVLPYVLLTVAVDLLGIYIIDWRHYLQAVYILLMALCFYLTGCHITLSNNKTAYATLVFPLLIMVTLFSAGPVIWVAGVFVVWLLLLLLGIFRANLESQAASAIQTLGIAVPFHVMAFLVLSAGAAFTYQVYLMLVDGAGIRVAWNYYFPKDSYDYMSYTDAEQQLVLGVSDLPDAAYLQRQLKVSEVYDISSDVPHFPWRQQLPYLQDYQQLSLHDSNHGIQWVFSHDSMSFMGRKDVSTRGQLTAQELNNKNPHFIANVQFDAVPVVLGEQVITAQKLYQYDPYLAHLRHQFSVPDNESLLTGIMRKGHHEVVLSSAALYVFDPKLNAATSSLYEPLSRIPLPQAHENLTAVAMAELVDTQMVGFLYGQLSQNDQYTAEQITYQLNNDYSLELLAQRVLSQGFSPFYRLRGFYLSPFWSGAYDGLISPAMAAEARQTHQAWHWPKPPKPMWILLFILTAVSCLLSYVILTHRGVNRFSKITQLLVVVFTNIPGLLFCWLYYPKQPALQAHSQE